MPLPFETVRLNLRPFQDDDLEPFMAYRSDPLVAQYQGWEAPYPREKAVAFVEEMKNKQPGRQDDWYQIIVTLKPDWQVIGDVAFHILAEDIQQAEIAFTLARSFWGYGYASEAASRLLDYLFGELHLHRVRAICDAENLASARVLERLGMRREGAFIENVWFKGKWGSEFLYAILAREWQERSANRI
ncbi:MAG TPA: GNAT family protein [Anaerolineaceae bacterium]|nr:GNAT family protein [Anaerolineaceae bacterium]